MWKLIVLYFGICLALFCTNIRGREVLDELARKRQEAKGRQLVSYSIVKEIINDSTFKTFYITATITVNGQKLEVPDTISVSTTSDGILVAPVK